VGDGNEWRVIATSNRLAAGRRELRDALAEIVKKAVENGWVDAGKTERWLEKLEGGITLKEGWPRYEVGLTRSGALVVRFTSPNPHSIRRETQRFREMGLEEGVHFTVKMPKDDRDGYVYIRREGLAHVAWLSVYGPDEQQKPAAEFVEYILQKAEEAGIPDAEYRVKQFVLELINILARAGERYRRDALKAVSTVEKTLRATAFPWLSVALYSVYSGLYSEAVVSSEASAV